MKTYWWNTLVLCIAVASPALAQNVEDAVRLATPGIGVGARALGMGNAYTGVSSDYSALYWNPAGLAQAEHWEFFGGLSYFSATDKSTYFGSTSSYTNDVVNLNALGLVCPVPVQRGSLVIAFGFDRQSNFTSGLQFSGFNPNSSIIQVWAPDGKPYPPNETLAEQLGLATADTARGVFVSPFKNRLTQGATVLEGKGLNNWSIGGAMDIARNLSLGCTLTYLAGSYRYDRHYTEEDLNGIYNVYPDDLKKLVYGEYIESNITGVNGTFGLMYREPDRFRFGITVKAPTVYYVHETFGATGSSTYKNGDSYGPHQDFENSGSTEYDITTPWVFGAGLSVILHELVISGDIDYTDWKSLEFSKGNPDVVGENTTIKQILRGAVNVRGGLEYDVRPLGVRLRGGFIYNRSPYEGDPSRFDQKIATGGLGILLGSSTMLDIAYARGWSETFRFNYDSSSRTDESISTNNILLTLVHRF